MGQPLISTETINFPTLYGVGGRRWTSHEELRLALESEGKCDFTKWAKDLLGFGGQDFWLPREQETLNLTAPTTSDLGLTEMTSAQEICHQGGRVFHLNILAAARGLEICFDSRNLFPWSMLLLINMMFIKVNGHPRGLFIICPGAAGRHLVDVVGTEERLPSDRFPGPIRVLFKQRFSL